MGLNAKDLKNLSRGDLLELLLAQTERVEEMDQERTELKKQLETKDILIEKTGTLAEAALAINQVFQAADRAAAQYLGNIMRIYDEQLEKNAKLEQEYAQKLALLTGDPSANTDSDTQEAEKASVPGEQTAEETVETPVATEQEVTAESMTQEATDRCETMIREATAKCDAMVQEATAKCDAMVQEATAKCDALQEETRANCAKAEAESQAKCREAEEATERACEEMKQKAREEAESYMKRVHAKLKKYVADHPELKALAKTKG